MSIDAHLHVWDRARARYDWLTPESGVLYRDHVLAETEADRFDLGIEGVVLVQSADNDEDTVAMLDTAAAHDEVLGVVGFAPWGDAAGIARRLDRWRAGGAPIVGTRNLIHERSDSAWVLRAEVDEGLGVLAEAGLPIDYPTSSPDALVHLATVAARQPRLRIVVDHLGKPPLGRGRAAMTRWAGLMADVASIPSVSMKVSGLYPAVGPMTAWTLDDVRPVFDTALGAFGADRLMQGGDWPIANLAGGYRRVWGALSDLVAPLPSVDRAAISGGTAAAFYGLDVRT